MKIDNLAAILPIQKTKKRNWEQESMFAGIINSVFNSSSLPEESAVPSVQLKELGDLLQGKEEELSELFSALQGLFITNQSTEDKGIFIETMLKDVQLHLSSIEHHDESSILKIENFLRDIETIRSEAGPILDPKSEIQSRIMGFLEEMNSVNSEAQKSEMEKKTLGSKPMELLANPERKSNTEPIVNTNTSLSNQMFYGRGNQRTYNPENTTIQQPLKLVSDMEIDHSPQNVNLDLAHTLNQISNTEITNAEITNQLDSHSNSEKIVSVAKDMFDKNFVILRQGEVTTSKIKLYPKELGEINVQLELIRGQLTVRIIASNDAAYNHLAENGKDLQQRFNDESFSSVNIEFSMEDNFNQDSNNNQNFANQFLKGVKNDNNPEQDEEPYQEIVTSSYNYKV